MEPEQFPDEVFLPIFEYLTQQELVNAAKSCERFHSIILSSTHLLNKIIFTVNSQNTSTICDRNANFPIHCMEVIAHGSQEYSKSIKSLFKAHQFTLKKLEFKTPSSSFISDVLEGMTQLTHLTIVGLKNPPSEEFPVSLPNLKSLSITEPSSYLRLIKNHQIEKLSIIDGELDPSRLSRALNNFLKKCPNLKDFQFTGIWPPTEAEKFEFTLESLSITFRCGLSHVNDHLVMKFLEGQRSVKRINLQGVLTRNVIEFAFNELKLEEMTIDMEKNYAALKDLKINKTLKKLTILKLSNDIENVKKLIVHSPKVESLKILQTVSKNFTKFMLEISNELESLRSLTLTSVPSQTSELMTFKMLQNLTINEVNSDDELVNFVEFSFGCPKVKNVTIERLGVKSKTFLKFDSEDLKNFLVDLEELETLKICGNFDPSKEFFDVVYETESNLKRLILDVILYSEINEVSKNAKILDEVGVKVTIPELVRWKREKWENGEESDEENDSEIVFSEADDDEDLEDTNCSHFCEDFDNDTSCDEELEDMSDFDEETSEIDDEIEDENSEVDELEEEEEELEGDELQPWPKKRKIE